MTDGDDPAAAPLGLLKLVGDPRKGFRRHGAGLRDGIDVNHQKPKTIGKRGDIAQRTFVFGECTVIAVRMIERRKFLAGHAADVFISVALKADGASVVQIVIARQDEYGNTRRVDPIQLLNQRFVAFVFAVECEIAGENQRVRLSGDHLIDKSIHQFVAVSHGFAVAVLNQLIEKRAVVGQRRRKIVQIRGRYQGFAERRKRHAAKKRERKKKFFHADSSCLLNRIITQERRLGK